MWVLSAKLESAFRKVRDIQEFIRTYVLVPNKTPVSIEDIQWAIQQKYDLDINKELIDFQSIHIRGMMERYQDGVANVFIKKTQDSDIKQNNYWRRFIATKEMMHLAIDEKEDWTYDGCETIEQLIKEHAFDGMRLPRDEIQSEVLAEVAAFEILYPMEFRQADINSGTPPQELSDKYEVPIYVISRALAQSYMKMARANWNEIGGHGLGGLGSDPAGAE